MAVGPVPIPAMTAAPHPKKTSANVPMNSAVGFFILLSLCVKIVCFATLQQLGFVRTSERRWPAMPRAGVNQIQETAAADAIIRPTLSGAKNAAGDTVWAKIPK
jgi:hypothetical protein